MYLLPLIIYTINDIIDTMSEEIVIKLKREKPVFIYSKKTKILWDKNDTYLPEFKKEE